MRVITGTAKGRKLCTPVGLDTRPTSEVVKEAVFSIIQFEVEGARVVDLFAGSGQMGIEALSRGARSCVFVDAGRESRRAQRENLRHTGLRGQVVGADVLSYLKGNPGPFDIAFLDPPYDRGLAEKALCRVAEVMAENGVILCETDRSETLPETAGAFRKVKEYRYGKAKITQYRPDTPAE